VITPQTNELKTDERPLACLKHAIHILEEDKRAKLANYK